MINIQWENSENVSINNTNTSALLEDVSDSLTYFADKYIVTRYQLATGNLVEYAGIKYIVVSQIDRNIENRKESQFSYRARIRQADYIIKVVIDGKVEQLPSIIEPQSFDIIDGKYISLSDDKIVATINNTYAISKGMRFIKLGSVWKVVGVDRTRNGILTLYCDVDLYNSVTDDLENEIANINLIDVEPEEPVDPPIEDGYTITIEGQGSIMLMTEGTYTAKVYNNGIEVIDKLVTWTKTTNLANIKSTNGNVITLSANTNWNVGEFKLRATLVDDTLIFAERSLLITG